MIALAHDDHTLPSFPAPPAAPYQGSSQEWYTPGYVIAAVNEVLGKIDLDPASCSKANATVGATTFYTEQQNGLTLPWFGRIWLNPPYGTVRSHAFWQGRSLAGFFYQKAIDEYRKGNIEQAILLVKADPKQSWFWPMWDFLICFARDRVYFDRPEGEAMKHQFGTCFCYLGPHEPRFVEVFSRFGDVARRVSPRYTRGTMQGLWTPGTDGNTSPDTRNLPAPARQAT